MIRITYSEMDVLALLAASVFCLCAGVDVELTVSPSSVMEGDSINLTCSVGVYDVVGAKFFNDNAVYLGYVRLLEGKCEDDRNDTCNKQCSCSEDGKGFTWTIFNVTRLLDSRGFLCGVKSPNTIFSSLRKIEVIYPPTEKVWLNPSSMQIITLKGKKERIECRVRGGNPLATLTWQCKGSPVIGYSLFNFNVAISIIIIPIDASYHRQQCVCTARHQASPNGVSGTKAVEFNVIYPPTENVQLSPSGNQTMLKGTNATLYCRVKGGNPLATLTWHCKGRRSFGEHWTFDDTAVSKLSFIVDPSYNNRQCVCVAMHQASPNGRFGKVAVLFDVLYIKIIRFDTSVACIRESGSFTRTCFTRGNPTPTAYWNHNGKCLTTENIHFLNIGREDAGNLTCIATVTHRNISLRSAKSFNIIVQYGPDVDLVIANTTAFTRNFRLNCTANGVPTNYTYRWIQKIGSTVIRDTFEHVTLSGSVSTLTIPRVSLQDMGRIYVRWRMGFQGEMVRLYREEKGSPQVIRARETYVTLTDVSFDINITFVSFPEPSITLISRRDSSLPPNDDPTISVSPERVRMKFYNKDVIVDGYMVQIHFNKFETGHKGHYLLYIKNEFDYHYNFSIVIPEILGSRDTYKNTGIVLISIAGLIIVSVLLNAAIFTLRPFHSRRTTTQSAKKEQPPEGESSTKNYGHHDEHHYDEIGMGKVGIQALHDIVPETRANKHRDDQKETRAGRHNDNQVETRANRYRADETETRTDRHIDDEKEAHMGRHMDYQKGTSTNSRLDDQKEIKNEDDVEAESRKKDE